MSQPVLDCASRFSLQGKRALVTDASQGIGAVTALFLAAPASDLICGQVVFIDGGSSAV